jgi:hypothetical protein
MAQNNFNNGPGGRLKREEKKNVSFGFMRPEQRIIGEPSTTSVYQPTPEIAESRIYLQSRPYDLKNQIVADVANATRLNVGNMEPEQYKRVATVIEELNKRHGNPSFQRTQDDRAYYNLSSVFLNTRTPNLSRNLDSPDDYFQELAHAAQFKESPIKSALKSLKGQLLYEDNSIPNKGRYGTPGEFEYEAHSEIAPQLWNEFKNIYKKKYGENIPPLYQNGKLKSYGSMMPEVEIVQPVKRP